MWGEGGTEFVHFKWVTSQVLMIAYSFQKLVMEPYEAFDVVSAGTVNFSKQKFCSWCHYSVRNAELVYLCGTHRQDGMNA